MSEIESLDISIMSRITQTLLYVNILSKDRTDLLKLSNLSGLSRIEPLPERLNLVDSPTDVHEVFKKYNIGW